MIPRTYQRAVAPLLLILATPLTLATASAAGRTDSAKEEFQSLRKKLRESHAANDWRSNLASATRLKELLNEAPNSLLEVARAEVRVGDTKAAVHELEQFVRMGQATDLLATSADFSGLLKNGDFAKIQSGMEANRSSISRGSTAFLLPDSGLLVEDVDYDRGSRRFFITSVREKKIFSISAGGASAEFAKAPDDWPMLAIKIDSARGVVWATEVALQGFAAADRRATAERAGRHGAGGEWRCHRE